MTAAGEVASGDHRHVTILRDVYADLTTLTDYAAENVVLHPADRAFSHVQMRGREAVLRHEQKLVSVSGGTLNMAVEHIVANDHFGAVLGTLHTQLPRVMAMPFCGLWRFADGLIVEHWENAYDPVALFA